MKAEAGAQLSGVLSPGGLFDSRLEARGSKSRKAKCELIQITYIYVYIYICVCIYIYIYIYVCVYSLFNITGPAGGRDVGTSHYVFGCSFKAFTSC